MLQADLSGRLAVDLDEELLEGSEVVGQRGVCDADLSRDRAEARLVGTPPREDLDGAVEDLLASCHALGVRPPGFGRREGVSAHARILIRKIPPCGSFYCY